MTSKRSIGWFLESSWAWTVFSPERSLNQPKATRVCIRSINQSNRSISVRLLFLFCSRVFIPRSYENRSPIIIYMMLTPKSSDKIQSLIFLRSTNKELTYHNSHEDQSLTLMHRFTNAGSRPWDKGGGRGRGGGAQKRTFFRPFGPQFGLTIRRRASPRAPPLDSPLFTTVRAEPSLVFLRKRERLAPLQKVYKFKNYRHFVISIKGLVFAVWKRRRKESCQAFEVNLVFSRQTGLFQWEYPLIDQQMVIRLSSLYQAHGY